MAVMMVIFFQAARLALVTFDPYLSSRPIAEALKRAPRGQLVIYGNHNAISSLLFYTEDKCLMLNGRYFNLEYGSYAPDAPPVFINDGGHFHDSSSEHILCNASFRSGCQNRRTLSTAWLGARRFCSRSPQRERCTSQPGGDMPAHGPAQKHGASIAHGAGAQCVNRANT